MRRSASKIALLVAVCLVTLACSHKMEIRSVPNPETMVLDGQDVVTLLRACGFSEIQILEYGPTFRNQIARYGGARIVDNENTRAVFAVETPLVFVSTDRGTIFIYDMTTRKIR